MQNHHLHKQFWVNLPLMCHCNTFFTITRTRRIYLQRGYVVASSSIRNASCFFFFSCVTHCVTTEIQIQWSFLIFKEILRSLKTGVLADKMKTNAILKRNCGKRTITFCLD